MVVSPFRIISDAPIPSTTRVPVVNSPNPPAMTSESPTRDGESMPKFGLPCVKEATIIRVRPFHRSRIAPHPPTGHFSVSTLPFREVENLETSVSPNPGMAPSISSYKNSNTVTRRELNYRFLCYFFPFLLLAFCAPDFLRCCARASRSPPSFCVL